MASTRAKFYAMTVGTTFSGGATVLLTATTADTPEDQAFWNATPAGTINLTITNPAAADVFTAGKYYYVDFTEAG